MMKQLFIKLLTFILLWLPLGAWAEWNSFVVNFGKDDFGTASSTWRISLQDEFVFFANQKGLLYFNGFNWMRFSLHNRSEVRGVKIFRDEGRVYVGGESEFGYFNLLPSGNLSYHCLSDSVEEKYRNLGNLYDFYESHNTLYIHGDNGVLIKNGTKYSFVSSVDILYASTMLDGMLYLATDHGLRMLMGNRFRPVPGGEALVGMRINCLVPYKGGLLVPTATNGIFFYDGKTATRVHTDVDDLLMQGVICCADIKDNQLALGTIRSGLVILNLNNGSVTQYDESRGLQSNTIQSLAFDYRGNVWCGLDYGIDYVKQNFPFSYLYANPNSFGIGLDALCVSGGAGDRYAYFATDRGCYVSSLPVRFSHGVPHLTQIGEIPSGTAWKLFQHGDDIFCLHDKGIFLLHGGYAEKITNLQGAWSILVPVGQKDKLILGLYGGLALLAKSNGKWYEVGRIKGFNKSGRYLRMTGPQTLKVYDVNLSKVTVLKLNASLTKVIDSQVMDEAYPDPDMPFSKQFLHHWDLIGNIVRVDDNRTIIPYSKGFLLHNKQKNSPVDLSVNIYNMYVTESKDSLVYTKNFLAQHGDIKLSYEDNSIKFEFGMSKFVVNGDVRYKYRLNKGEWSELTTATTKEYSNLSEGKYTFEVKGVVNNIETVDKLAFTILPPWYRTWIAYLVYFLCLVIVVAWSAKLVNRRYAKKQAEALKEKNQEVDRMAVEIDQLEKEKMELDLKHKSQEIANLVLSVSRKNEILNDIKESVAQVVAKINRNTAAETKRQLILISNNIDANQEGDDVMRKFEEQFDVVHNNFITHLRARYPNLNHNELLMCAYLKMNLSNKEIAPLLNISVRGVETIRYRLRKKFDIDRYHNLTDFLNKV